MPEIISQQDIKKEYEPYMALILYKCEENSTENHYIEQHDIKKNVLQEGRPLTEETIKTLAKKYTDKIKEQHLVSRGLIENLLFIDPIMKKYIWWNVEQQKPLHFAKKLNIPNGTAFMPPLLFIYNGGDLDVFALNSNERPTAKTVLYRAPFHNTGNRGSVCMGSAEIKIKDAKFFEDIIRGSEHAFFGSNFTHITGSENPCRTNINILWKKLIGTKKKFPMNELIETNWTMGELISPKKKRKR